MIESQGEVRRLSPVTRSGYLVEATVARCAEGVVSEYRRRFIEFKDIWHLPIPELETEGITDLIPGLNRLFPLASKTTRYLVVPTISKQWCTVFIDTDSDQPPEFIAGLNRAVGGRVIFYFAVEHSLKKVRSNFYIGHYGGAALWLFSSGKPLEPDRAVSCVRETSGWKFDQYGTPLPFEDTGRYTLPKKKDRFDMTLLRQYLRQFAIDPFDISSFSVSKENSGRLVKLLNVPPEVTYVDEKTLQEEWYMEMGL